MAAGAILALFLMALPADREHAPIDAHMQILAGDAGHIGLESLLVLAPEALRLKMELLIQGLVLLFGLVMAYNCGLLAQSVWNYKIPTLGISEAFKYIPPAFAGALVALFSLEHIIALLRGEDVEPAWH